MNYYLVDVFSPHPFSGNSLTVFPDSMLSLEGNHFLRITREMRHFESIFLRRVGPRAYSARVFDLSDELEFAGHPVIGASCVLHWLHGDEQNERWSIQLPAKTVDVVTFRRDSHYYAELNQGKPEFFDIVPKNAALGDIVTALNLKATDLHPDLPAQVVSTGLKYLILPILRSLGDARIVHHEFERLLASVGAQFVYVLQVDRVLEGRHWNNDGVVEDIATGSGAGCVAAYLAQHKHSPLNHDFILNQGRFVGRPSRISLRVEGGNEPERVIVGGEVSMVGQGKLSTLPEKTLS